MTNAERSVKEIAFSANGNGKLHFVAVDLEWVMQY